MKKVEKSSFAGTTVESSTNVEVEQVSQPIAKPNVGGSFLSKKPLDDYVDIIRKRFPKYISIEETKCNAMKQKYCALFRQEHYNEYCFIEYYEGSESYSITLFQSDWKDFERIESDFLNFKISFSVGLNDLKTIMNCMV